MQILIALIVWAAAVFLYELWWRRRGEKEYKEYWDKRPPKR